jgi:hypothetical protein
MSRRIRTFGAACFAVILCGVGSHAQTTHGSIDEARGPLPLPYSGLASQANDAESVPNPDQLTADERPLSGVQELSVGKYGEGHNFIIPSFSVTTQLDPNPRASGYNGPTSVSYLLGRLSVHHISSRSELVLDYIGGGMLSRGVSSVNSVIQDLEFSDTYKWQRWSLLLGDEVRYLSESPFGFGGIGTLGFWGGVSELGPGGTLEARSQFLITPVTPSQTIPTPVVPRLSNTAVLQLEYAVSPRSSWTAAGSYGLLRFRDIGYINSSNTLFQTGYNYQVSPLDTVGVLYRFNSFRFTESAEGMGIEDQVIQLTYARRVTGLLSFQLAAGPDLMLFRHPMTRSATDVSWSASALLTYQLDRTALYVSYNHLLTAGSGVLVGAQTDVVQGTLGRSLSQNWQGSVFFGYANNHASVQTTSNPVETSVDYYGGVQASHRLGRGAAFFIGYSANLRSTPAAACPTPLCGSHFLAHELSLGFNWGLPRAPFR